MVNVALPAIGVSLHASPAALQWTISAYLLPLSALLLLGGAAGDRFGRRRLLIGGIVLFALASAACAAAPSLAILLPARAVQGVGAAMLMPNSLAILGGAFTGAARGRAIGTWAAAGAIAAAAGPPLGGWLIEVVGWRAIFLLNLPVAAVALVLARRGIAENHAAGQPLDWPGALLATAALGTLTWALTLWSSRQAVDTLALIGLVAGALLLGGFLRHEQRRGPAAMMPLALFASRAFAGLSLLTFLLYGALGGLLVLLPYMLMRGAAYSPLQAGFALLPFPLVVGAASRLTGAIAGRIGPRLPLTIGSLIVAAGFALLVRVAPGAPYWTGVAPGVIGIAIGMAGAAAPLTTAVLSSVDGAHTGTASGLNSAISRTGGLVATACAGAVIARQGGALFTAFHVAALVGTLAAAAAALTAWLTLASLRPKPQA